MTPIPLTTSQWHDIHPEYRAIVDNTPHVFAYDDEREAFVLAPVAIKDLRSAPTSNHQPSLQPA